MRIVELLNRTFWILDLPDKIYSPNYVQVEPAELSLDLAKMTPEIRNSEEVRFARDVARLVP